MWTRLMSPNLRRRIRVLMGGQEEPGAMEVGEASTFYQYFTRRRVGIFTRGCNHQVSSTNVQWAICWTARDSHLVTTGD